MDIKFDSNAATTHSSTIQASTNTGSQSIEKDGDSNLPAVPNCYSAGETGLSAVSAYLSFLKTDANRISSLDSQWQDFEANVVSSNS